MARQAAAVQYTIRGVPREVDRALRRRAAQRKQSLNQLIIEDLSVAARGSVRKADFSDVVGKWTPAPAFDEVLALTDLFQGDTELAARLASCTEIWIPLIVLGEIKAGFLGGAERHRNEILLHKFLAKATVNVLLPGRETAREHYAPLFVQLKRAKHPGSG